MLFRDPLTPRPPFCRKLLSRPWGKSPTEHLGATQSSRGKHSSSKVSKRSSSKVCFAERWNFPFMKNTADVVVSEAKSQRKRTYWPQTLLDLCLNPIAGTKATLLASARVTQLELAIPCRGGWKAWVKIAVEKSPPGRVSKIPLSRDKSFCRGTVIPQTFNLWRGFKLSNFLR